MKSSYSLPCNIAQTLNLIGDRWTLLILHRLLMGYGTFKELQECLDGIPSNLLSDRLKELESDGLVKRELYREHPPRYRYVLSESGKELNHVFNAFAIWGEKHLTTCYKHLVHKDCRHGVEQRYYCSRCDSIVSCDDLTVLDAQE